MKNAFLYLGLRGGVGSRLFFHIFHNLNILANNSQHFTQQLNIATCVDFFFFPLSFSLKKTGQWNPEKVFLGFPLSLLSAYCPWSLSFGRKDYRVIKNLCWVLRVLGLSSFVTGNWCYLQQSHFSYEKIEMITLSTNLKAVCSVDKAQFVPSSKCRASLI